MGLDQYAYTTDKEGNRKDFFYWRKHPAIQYWMESLWESKGRPNFNPTEMGGSFGDFNCAPVPLDKDDLLQLKKAVEENKLNYEACGFFFGESASPTSEHFSEEKEDDLAFITKALGYVEKGQPVYYTSWW